MPRQSAQYSEFVEMILELNRELEGFAGEHERLNVLAGAAVLDQVITRTVRGFLAESEETDDLFDPKRPGPLGAFAAKVKLAVALGLLPKSEAKHCLTLASIRNEFAHLIAPDFDPSMLGKLEAVEKATETDRPEGVSPGGRYKMLCVHLSLHIALRWEHRPLEKLQIYPDPLVWKLAEVK